MELLNSPDFSTDRCTLLPPAPLPEGALARESVQSYVRRACLKNQIHVSSFVSEAKSITASHLQSRIKLSNGCSHLISKGGRTSEAWLAALEKLTVVQSPWSMTTRDLVSLAGVGPLTFTRRRHWCPMCLQQDLLDFEPFERLLWTIDEVAVCHIHRCFLVSNCPSCGSDIPMLLGKDCPGYCPYCDSWLGGSARQLDETRDEATKYLLWVSRSFADLLDSPIEPGIDAGIGFRSTLERLRDFHFGGKSSHLASALDRNKSVVATWLSQRSSPSWRAINAISFAFHIPIHEVLAGAEDCIQVSYHRALPLQVSERRARRRPQRSDLPALLCLFAKIQAGGLPHIQTMTGLVPVLNISVREMRRLAKAEAQEVAKTLTFRRKRAKAMVDAARMDALMREIFHIVRKFYQHGRRPSRRAVAKELRLAGFSMRRNEHKLIFQVRDQVLLEQATIV